MNVHMIRADTVANSLHRAILYMPSASATLQCDPSNGSVPAGRLLKVPFGFLFIGQGDHSAAWISMQSWDLLQTMCFHQLERVDIMSTGKMEY